MGPPGRILALVLLISPLGAEVTAAPKAAVVYMTPDGHPGYSPAVAGTVEALRWSTEAFTGLPNGATVQLLPSGGPGATAIFSQRVVIWNKQELTIRGLDRRTIIQGSPVESLRCPQPAPDKPGCAGGEDPFLAALIEGVASGPRPEAGSALLMDLLPSADPLAMVAALNPFRSSAVCVDLQHDVGITLENLSFRDCWYAAVRADRSTNIMLRRSVIVGSSYGLAIGRDRKDAETDKITVEDVRWVQDASGYDGDLADRCNPAARWKGGCPGRLWRSIPWGSAHHGTFGYFNGALLGGYCVREPVVFRRNVVENAYNGIRLVAKDCGEDQPVVNSQVLVEGNYFSYIRDNPVEFENLISNAYVSGNQFHDAHAWISLDGAGGGPVYVFGNTGWFDDLPSRDWNGRFGTSCTHAPTFPSNAPVYDVNYDRNFDYRTGQWLPVGVEGRKEDGSPEAMTIEDMACGHETERVLKIGTPDPDPKKFNSYSYLTRGPLYIFNNSWYLRGPLTGGGMVQNLKHWNNAIRFCEPGKAGYDEDLCGPSQAAMALEADCMEEGRFGLKDYPAASGSIPFFDCFRWVPVDPEGKELPGALLNQFDFDVSSNGFPPDLQAAGIETHGRRAEPGFRDPAQGDFTLVPGAAAAQSPCVVELVQGALTCKIESGGFAGAIGPDGQPYTGPSGLAVPR